MDLNLFNTTPRAQIMGNHMFVLFLLLFNLGVSQAAPADDRYETNLSMMHGAQPCTRIHVRFPADAKVDEYWKSIDNAIVTTRSTLITPVSQTRQRKSKGLDYAKIVPNPNGPKSPPTYVEGSIDIKADAARLARAGGMIFFTSMPRCTINESGRPVLLDQK